MEDKAIAAVMGLLVTLMLAASIYFPLAAIHDSNDADVLTPAAPGPVILSDQFPVDQDVLEQAIQEP